MTKLSTKMILVVVDDYYAAKELAATIESAGAAVLGPISTLDEALAFVQTSPSIDGAVLDINLGGQMVFPVADELQRLGVPFIFATGYEPDLVPARHAGTILLRKPLEYESVLSALRDAADVEPVALELALRNTFLAKLPRKELNLILPHLKQVCVPRGTVLEQNGQTVMKACFPISNVVSVLTVGASGERVEIGLIDREGMTGTGLFFGDRLASFELLNQVEGQMLFITGDDLEAMEKPLPGLQLLAARLERTVSVQVGFTALANARVSVLRRLARWLLMIHDRVQEPGFRVTHELLALMLGVRRPSVTDMLHVLEGRRLIRSTRGFVEIRNRDGLIRTVGDIYGVAELEYERVMNIALPEEDVPFRPEVPLSEQTNHDLMWIREDFLDYLGAFEKIVVHGHTPTESGSPESFLNRIAVDTKAYDSGVLSAVLVTEVSTGFVTRTVDGATLHRETNSMIVAER